MYSQKYKLKFLIVTTLAFVGLLTAVALVSHSSQSALASTQCGKGATVVHTSIDLGCRGEDNAGSDVNPILDMLYAFTRFLTAGVGIVIVGSVVVGGLQYTTAQGEPQKQAAARGRVISALGALVLFLFTFALLQWLIPGGLF